MLKFNGKRFSVFVSRVIVAAAVLCIFTGCSKNKAASASSESTVKPAERIVCLSPSGAEILYAVNAGDRIAARTDFCDFPEEIKKLPSVGGYSGDSISLEAVLSYSPDFVYGSVGMHEQLKASLEAAGVRVYLSAAGSVADVMEEITYIGKITGCEKNAEAVVSGMKKDIESCSKKFSGVSEEERPEVYYEVWFQPYMSAGNRSFINEIISLAGGRNVFASVDQDYPMVSEEAIIASNADVIVLPSSNGITAENVRQRNGWKVLKAVQEDKVFIVDGDVFSRPGPRVTDAIKELTDLLYK